MPTPKALHSHNTVQWGTPKHIVELSRQVLGNIYLDPASTLDFNDNVRARKIYTVEDNGLAQDWEGTVFLNPPGGLVSLFWNKLCIEHVQKKTVPAAIWVGFSLEQLATLASEPLHPLDFPTCILRKRLGFLKPDLSTGGSPAHGNYVTYMGQEPELFLLVFFTPWVYLRLDRLEAA